MSDRSAITSFCLLGILVFLVLSSGIIQCAYNCLEEDSLQDVSMWSQAQAAHRTDCPDCHYSVPETQQTVRCPDRSCHQGQADGRSLDRPEITGYAGSQEPVLSGSRLPLPELRIGQVLKQKTQPEPVLLASWQPPATTSQTLLSVKTTVMLN